MRRIVKVLTGNEHGGAANSSEWLIDGILERRVPLLDFHIIMLCEGDFAKKIASKHPKHTIVLPLTTPPIIGNGGIAKRIWNTILLSIWIFKAFWALKHVLRYHTPNLIHTTNNYALMVCAIHRLFYPIPVATHWRRIGGIRNILDKWLISHVDSIYCISDAVRNSLPPEWHYKCKVIYNGCPIDKLINEGRNNEGKLRQYLKIDRKTYLFGTIGTYTSVKCHELLIESCKLLHTSCPNLDFRCVLIGSCPSDACKIYLGELKKKIHQYTLDNYVIIVFDNEIAHPFSLISDFDVFVGSTWMGGKGEGFGLIYVEALSQGVPVIAISVGAAPEIISPEVGILASDNSAKQHKSLLEKLSNTAERNRFNRDYIRQYAYRFDISNTVSAILSQYGV